MTDQPADSAVRRSITVDAPVERAFAVFTDGLGTWWPHDYSVGGQPMQTAVIEPRQGGRWLERAADGTECPWGRVLAWEPPHRVMLSWQITPEWQPEPDPEKASEIEVRFVAESPQTTRVEREHRGFERHGTGGDSMRESVGGGWGGLLELFAKAAQG